MINFALSLWFKQNFIENSGMRPILSTVGSGFKIAYLFLLLLIGIFVSAFFAKLILLIHSLNDGGEIASIYINSITYSVFAIALPAYIVVALTSPAPISYLKVKSRGVNMIAVVLFALSAYIFSYAFTSFLAQWNRGMSLPDFMSGIEKLMRSMEDAALETTNLLLSGKTVSSLILNITVLAGFAALSEELFFRGALQQFLVERYKNGHLAVWLSALIFSLVHFQFYGFLPRLFLGAILGYLFLYSHNLWTPIIFHFFNNATLILINYFWGETEWFDKIENAEIGVNYLILALVSLILTLLLFVGFKKIFLSSGPIIENREQNSAQTED